MSEQLSELFKLQKLEETLQKMLESVQGNIDKLDMEWRRLHLIAQEASGQLRTNEAEAEELLQQIDDQQAINETPLDLNVVYVNDVKQPPVEVHSSDEEFEVL